MSQPIKAQFFDYMHGSEWYEYNFKAVLTEDVKIEFDDYQEIVNLIESKISEIKKRNNEEKKETPGG